MIRILLVEDDETIAFGITAGLAPKGYSVTACASIREAKEAYSRQFGLILLDLNLPDGSGYEFCRWAKEGGDIPVIFLTVRDDARDITRGLDMGADDYIVKPFQLSVLEARIRAVLRRLPEAGNTWLSCGSIRLEREKMQAFLGDREVALSALEYRLLVILLENKGQTLPRNSLLDKLWDVDGNFVNDNTLTVTVKRLREKLGQTEHIRTVRGIGYRMEEMK